MDEQFDFDLKAIINSGTFTSKLTKLSDYGEGAEGMAKMLAAMSNDMFESIS
jgi:hypothetical protein